MGGPGSRPSLESILPQSFELVCRLPETFSCFKLTPKAFEESINPIKASVTEIRKQERSVIAICVRTLKMPRKTFIELFVGHETEDLWLNHVLEDPQYSDEAFRHEVELRRAQRKLRNMQKTTGVTLAEVKDIHRRISKVVLI